MKKPKSKHLTPTQLKEIEALYPNMSNEDIAAIYGLSPWTIKSRGEQNGWHKSKEYMSKLNRDRAIRCNIADRINTPESYAKRNITRKKLYEREKLRISLGFPQLTRRHFTSEPKAKLLQRNRLQRLGYIVDNENLIAYYTPQTKRATRLERIPRGVKKGTIKPFYEFREWIG